MADLRGKVALVRGASKGIGHALAVGLGAAGAAVVANYHSDEAGARDAAERIRAAGGRAIVAGADVSSVAAATLPLRSATAGSPPRGGLALRGAGDGVGCTAGVQAWRRGTSGATMMIGQRLRRGRGTP